MPTYDISFDPPAPLAAVELRNPTAELAIRDIPMIIDSGADVTLVPRPAVAEIEVDLHGPLFELTSFDGGSSLVRSVRLDLGFMKRTWRGHYLVLDRDYGILGRDILNQVAILLDGPDLTWGLLGPRALRRLRESSGENAASAGRQPS